MQPLRQIDFIKRLRQRGVAGQVLASQVVTAMKLYIQSEFPQQAQRLHVVSYKNQTLFLRSYDNAVAQRLVDQTPEIQTYLQTSLGVRVKAIKFKP